MQAGLESAMLALGSTISRLVLLKSKQIRFAVLQAWKTPIFGTVGSGKYVACGLGEPETLGGTKL